MIDFQSYKQICEASMKLIKPLEISARILTLLDESEEKVLADKVQDNIL